METIVSLNENPSSFFGKYYTENGRYHGVFSNIIFDSATLYVPKGTVNKYKGTDGWKDFRYIEEDTGDIVEKCAKPTISYQNATLNFHSDTEGAICLSSITDTDMGVCDKNERSLTVTYHISVFAMKEGFLISDVAEATLCWIDVQPQTEGVEVATNMQSIEALPVLIQTNGGVVSITGAAEGTEIDIYDVSGKLVGAAKASAGTTDICTSLHDKDIAIVRIGNKSVKVVVR